MEPQVLLHLLLYLQCNLLIQLKINKKLKMKIILTHLKDSILLLPKRSKT